MCRDDGHANIGEVLLCSEYATLDESSVALLSHPRERVRVGDRSNASRSSDRSQRQETLLRGSSCSFACTSMPAVEITLVIPTGISTLACVRDTNQSFELF